MDWTFGSSAIKKREEQFNAQHGDNVWFGVGTFGTDDDPLKVNINYLAIVHEIIKVKIRKFLGSGSLLSPVSEGHQLWGCECRSTLGKTHHCTVGQHRP